VLAHSVLDGRVVLLAGGGSGLGRAIAQELTAVGAPGVTCGGRDAPLRETVALCPAGRCQAEACDLREEDQIDATLARHGRVDVLFNIQRV
jgi:NAD(P)-dependent dehydrogenase (short-subunit alcohol dehydrogenase family)